MREPDELLYGRYVAREDAADLEALLVRHREGLFLFLLGYVGSPEDAEELLMDTFARLAVDKPRFDPRRPGSFKSWLYAIARNNARMQIRRGRVKTAPLHEGIPAGDDLPEVSLLKDERNRMLYRALETLKSEYRQALTLLYLEGLNHDEIAAAMGLRKPQLYDLLKRGKAALKRALEGMGMRDAQY